MANEYRLFRSRYAGLFWDIGRQHPAFWTELGNLVEGHTRRQYTTEGAQYSDPLENHEDYGDAHPPGTAKHGGDADVTGPLGQGDHHPPTKPEDGGDPGGDNHLGPGTDTARTRGNRAAEGPRAGAETSPPQRAEARRTHGNCNSEGDHILTEGSSPSIAAAGTINP
ncbi:hypothetical protein RF55_19561 [Lasius niger]|uniref:Uncharacterized protein n=1 Tax=Lasius niger TaxID=67767 RepID=A0A0J7JZX9_LASNI|nr:hypothetical protein RF55_19561 [Lasius niger]